MLSQSSRYRNTSAPRATLRRHRSFAFIPGTLDLDYARLQVDVFPPKAHQLAPAKAAVESGCPNGAVRLGHHLEEPTCFGRRSDSVAGTSYSRQVETDRR